MQGQTGKTLAPFPAQGTEGEGKRKERTRGEDTHYKVTEYMGRGRGVHPHLGEGQGQRLHGREIPDAAQSEGGGGRGHAGQQRVDVDVVHRRSCRRTRGPAAPRIRRPVLGSLLVLGLVGRSWEGDAAH